MQGSISVEQELYASQLSSSSVIKREGMRCDEIPTSRQNDLYISCPIVVGSMAYTIPKRPGDNNTHQWLLFVRGPNDEDLSTFVDRIVFGLHQSFANPIREIQFPPFQVCEFGWGEFEASIRIYFKDSQEQPVDLFHTVKLYPAMANPPSIKKPPVVCEFIDEIVFSSPRSDFAKKLMSYGYSIDKERCIHFIPLDRLSVDSSVMVLDAPTSNSGLHYGPLADMYTVFSDATDYASVVTAADLVTNEIQAIKRQLLLIENELLAYGDDEAVGFL